MVSGNLNAHLHTPAGQQLFSCGVYKNSFSLSRNLKLNLHTHNGERLFTCGICKIISSCIYTLIQGSSNILVMYVRNFSAILVL